MRYSNDSRCDDLFSVYEALSLEEIVTQLDAIRLGGGGNRFVWRECRVDQVVAGDGNLPVVFRPQISIRHQFSGVSVKESDDVSVEWRPVAIDGENAIADGEIR